MRRSWLRLVAGVLVCASAAGPLSCRKQEPDEFARLMNLGKAHLENRDSAKALKVLNRAVELQPESAPAWRNLARAHLMARTAEAALVALGRAQPLERDSPATSYLRGLALLQSSKFEEAVAAFEEAVRLDPQVAAMRFQLSIAYQAVGKNDQALEQQRETVRLDPLHSSAQFKLATHARRTGDTAEFERRNREFLRLRQLFGEETRSAEALEQCIYTQPEPASMPVPDRDGKDQTIDVRFIDATENAFTSEGDAVATAMTVIEVDPDGRSVLFVVDDAGGLALMRMNAEGVFARTRAGDGPHSGPFGRSERAARDGAADGPHSGPYGRCDRAVMGDFHNTVPEGATYDAKLHARSDVVLLGEAGVWLLKQTEPGTFSDVTASAGLTGRTADAARWVDVEHDGDLDLLLAGPSGLEVWQNHGDGTFSNVTADVGIEGTGPAVRVVAADLDANNAVDLIAARGPAPTLVFENQRVGRFAARPDPPGPWPAAEHVLIDDLNNDGRLDVVLVGGGEAVTVLGGIASRGRLEVPGVNVKDVALLDFDNDGRLDLLAAGADPTDASRGGLRLFRGRPAADGSVAWADVTTSTGLDAVQAGGVGDVIAADLDADGDTDLLLRTEGDRLHYLRNEGGQVNGQLKVCLLPTKTNPSGYGTHVELRQGPWRVTRAVTGLPIEIGLAGRAQLDTVQAVWTNGVVDNQIDVAVGTAPFTIVEKVVATGSCPFLYAWNGDGYRFVTDILGNSPLGLSLKRDVLLPADPDEFVEIGPADSFPPHDGRYELVLTEETREVLFLDEARLVAVDHPADVEVHPTDKLMPPPFPVSELWAVRRPRPLLRAEGNDGIDRTEALGELDGVFAPPGRPLPPPYRGLCDPLSITLDFGRLSPGEPLVLALTGWLQYGDASTNIAASQNASLEVIPPTLEAETAPGVWTQLDVVVGMPAGKTKTTLVDLAGRLPSEVHRLRLLNSYEIRWDRFGLFERAALPAEHVHEVLPGRAQLYYRGFSEIRSRAPGHPTTPAHDQVSPRPPWRTTPAGWCTRYGDVLELVTRRDDALVLVNAGDALTLQFDADALPPVPEDHTRTFFFYSVGWDKDEDHNVVDGDTVEPLPASEPGRRPAFDENGAAEDWQIRYNTRWVPHEFTVPR